MRVAHVLAVALFLFVAGCAAPQSSSTPRVDEDCVPLVMSPLAETIRPRETFLGLNVEFSNCSTETLIIDAGPCGIDLLPTLARSNVTWVLRNGAALQRETIPCEDGASQLTLKPGETGTVTAKWNGQLETPEGRIVDAPPGPYRTHAAAFGHTVEGNVTVE